MYVLIDETNRLVALLNINKTTQAEKMGYVWLDYSKTLTEHEVFTVDGIPKLKIVEGKIVKRALKEIEADRASLPPPPPTTDERVADVEEQLSQIKIAYQNGVNHA